MAKSKNPAAHAAWKLRKREANASRPKQQFVRGTWRREATEPTQVAGAK